MPSPKDSNPFFDELQSWVGMNPLGAEIVGDAISAVMANEINDLGKANLVFIYKSLATSHPDLTGKLIELSTGTGAPRPETTTLSEEDRMKLKERIMRLPLHVKLCTEGIARSIKIVGQKRVTDLIAYDAEMAGLVLKALVNTYPELAHAALSQPGVKDAFVQQGKEEAACNLFKQLQKMINILTVREKCSWESRLAACLWATPQGDKIPNDRAIVRAAGPQI